MRIIWRSGTSAAGAALALVADAGAPAWAEPTAEVWYADSPRAVKDSYVVSLRDTVDIESTAAALAARYGGRVRYVYTAAMRGFSVAMNERQARRLAAHPSVASVRRNETIARRRAVQATSLWGLDRIDQRNLPLDQHVYRYRAQG